MTLWFSYHNWIIVTGQKLYSEFTTIKEKKFQRCISWS